MNPLVTYIKQAIFGLYTESEAFAIAKWLLTEHFHFSTMELYGGKDRTFSEKEKQELNDILRRLLQKEPIQYILGREVFFNLSFEVNPSVLIPRPETEELVRWVIEEFLEESSLKILDVGTGSGCIAISLAKHFKNASVTAWDISEDALQTAQRNAQHNRSKVQFLKQNVFDSYSSSERFHVIVSNPPYIKCCERSGMDAQVVQWEPESALFVPDDDPFVFYRRITDIGKCLLFPKGKLFFEINQRYGAEVCQLLRNGGFHDVELRKDMNGNDRMIKAVL